MDNSAWSSVNYTVEQVKDENPQVWLDSAIKNIEAGFYDEAMEDLDEALNFAGMNKDIVIKAKAEKIRVYYILGDINSAKDMLDSIGEKNAKSYYCTLPDLVLLYRKYDYATWQPLWQNSVEHHMMISDFNFIDKYIDDIEIGWIENYGVREYVEHVVKTNNEGILERLIACMNLSDMKFLGGKNLLMIVIENKCHDSIIKTVMMNCTKSIDYQDRDGCTALQVACHYSNKNIVEMILNYGADVNIADNDGNVALHYAVDIVSYDNVLLLLEHGAKINVVNNDNDTPVLFACINNNASLVRLLLSRGGNPNKINSKSLPPLLIAAVNGLGAIAGILIEYGAYVHEKISDDEDILFVAYKHNSVSVLKCLFAAGVDVNQRYRSKNNRNLLHCIAADNHWSDKGKEIWHCLLGAGIDIDAQDGDGNTAAMLSVDHSWLFSDELDLVRALVDRKANLNLRNHANKTIDDILRKRKIDRSKLFNSSSSNFFSKLFS